MSIKARVENGRLLVNEPTSLPEGAEIELFYLDPGDDLDDEERERLHAALREAEIDVAAGRVVEAEEFMKGLKAK